MGGIYKTYSVHGINVFAGLAAAAGFPHELDPLSIQMKEDTIDLVCSIRVSRPFSRIVPQ